VILRIDHLKSWEDRMQRLRTPYKKILYGASTEIIYGDKKMHFVGNIGDERFEGFHIVGIFKKELIKNIDTLEYNKKINDRSLFYIWHHKENILRHMNSQIGIMDINSCYFDTANILGYVSKNLYKNAYKKVSEYKTARNIAIGSLATNKTVFEIDENGKSKLCSPILADERYKAIRRTIIYHVGKFSLEVLAQFPNDIFMFQTDCFYYNKKIEKDLKEFVNSHGYNVKTTIGDLLSFSETNTSVIISIYDYKDCKYKDYKMSKANEVNNYLNKIK
jgi:hypothetical protein